MSQKENLGTKNTNSSEGIPSTEDVIWADLVRWVQTDRTGKSNSDSTSDDTGGYVHPSLTLSGSGPSRGVWTKAPIAKGETLIRLRSEHVLSGAAAAKVAAAGDKLGATAKTTGSSVATVSPWLRCIAAFLRAQRDRSELAKVKEGEEEETNYSSNYGPYLRSLPKPDEYETLLSWSADHEVKPFLKGTTLGKLVAIDRTTKGIETRYRDSVKPYLIKAGALDGKPPSLSSPPSPTEKPASPDVDYQAFLEATMCISTRGFHLLPTKTDSKDSKSTAGMEDATSNNSSDRYDGPFLLPVIDLLNHDPGKSCTTLKRYKNTGSSISDGGFFIMAAEREIAEDEEIFHSYGTDLTSAQLLQTFGFVPRKHSSNVVAAATSELPKALPSATPVSLRTGDHLIAAARLLKLSSFPDAVMDRMRNAQGASTADGWDNADNADECFWEVCDISDRDMGFDNDEFLISAWQSRNRCLLTEDTVTLVVAQFLPSEAFDEIFPDTSDGNNIKLDRSILLEDYYLGMLVCKSLLVALFLRAREYCTDSTGLDDKGSVEAMAKAISGGAPVAVGRYISSLLQKESSVLSKFLEEDDPANDAKPPVWVTEREVYGRTIRAEELTNLMAFFKEVETLMESLCLDGVSDNDEDACAHKKMKVE